MKEFTFEAKQKNMLLITGVIGIACLAASYIWDPTANHTRFWTNLLHNASFFALISFTATFAIAATTLAYAGWNVAFRRIWEAISLILPLGLVCLLLVGLGAAGHLHHLYHWADKEAVANDEILTGKSGFLNIFWYFFAVIGFGGMWYFFAKKFRSNSLAQDEDSDASYPWYKKQKFWAAIFMPLAGFSSAAAIWLWLMSLDAHWYSTMYAWYTTASAFVSMICITILLLVYLKGKGYFTEVTVEHLHDLGKFLFAFSVFWTYLWFSQYMLIWYANIGEETIYFHQRMGEFPVLFYGNLVLNFVLPFLILIRNDTKRKVGTLTFVAIFVLFGHWVDFFQMTKIGPYKSALEHHAHSAAGNEVGKKGNDSHAPSTGHESATHDTHAAVADSHAEAHDTHEEETPKYFQYNPDVTAGFGIPSFFELGTFLGFLAIFIFFVLRQLERAALVPKNDPYLEETLHHHA